VIFVQTVQNKKNREIKRSFFVLAFTDGFSTLRSVRSHVTEVSSVMTANVSDPASSGGRLKPPPLQQHQQQLSPPAQPVSTLQHNYSNIQQPSPVLAAAVSDPLLSRNGLTASQRPSGPNSLTGSSNNASPFAQLAVTATPAIITNGNTHAPVAILPPGVQGGAFSRSAVRPRTPTDEPRAHRRRERAPPTDDAKKSKLGNLNDLIHLEPPLNEDAVIRALQARFFNQKYYVSFFFT